jgi:transcriptional regulator with XRE-family HTH domain
MVSDMMEQKIKPGGTINIGANIRSVRKKRGIGQTELVGLLQVEGVTMTRESLVKIERGIQHIQASQLRAIRDALLTTYDDLLAEEYTNAGENGTG